MSDKRRYAEKYPKAVYTPVDRAKDYNPLWDHKADCAFPSATQNEINAKDAKNLLKNGVYVVGEGANMPTHFEGVRLFLDAKILYAPGKAANAGGVAVSGLEMAQNSMRIAWTREEVDRRLHDIMINIHKIDDVKDAEAYVARLRGFPKLFDQLLVNLKAREGLRASIRLVRERFF